jgi:hypothetical protein
MEGTLTKKSYEGGQTINAFTVMASVKNVYLYPLPDPRLPPGVVRMLTREEVAGDGCAHPRRIGCAARRSPMIRRAQQINFLYRNH